jgi:hypothetical protein
MKVTKIQSQNHTSAKAQCNGNVAGLIVAQDSALLIQEYD